MRISLLLQTVLHNTCEGIMKALFTLSDFQAPASAEDLGCTFIAYSVLIIMAQSTLSATFGYFRHSLPYCDKEKHRKIFARQFTALGVFLLLSHDGIVGSLNNPAGHVVPSGTVEYGVQRVYSYSPYASRLGSIHLAWQVQNFFVALKFGDGIEHMIHHVVTASLAYFSFQPYLHIYSPFFFGVTEISSIFLTVVCFFVNDRHSRMYIEGIENDLPGLRVVAGGLFVVLFFLTRIVIWPYISYYFWRDNLALLRSKKGNDVHSYAAVYTFMAANCLLTFLQFFWFKDILKNALLTLQGKNDKKRD